jgi:YVTN family beta-propeller protein
VFADLSLRVTIAQLQRLLQDGLYGAWELRFPSSRHQDHFPTASQQMRQTGLVQCLNKLTIDAPTIPHQKACEVCSQHCGRLFKSSPGLNRIDGYLGGAESPHPPQLSADSPTRLVRSHTSATANFFDQRLIGRFRFPGYPGHGLAQTAPTHLQSEGLLERGGRFPVGQSQTFIQLCGQRQRPRAQLGGRTAHRIRGLPGMPPLHPPPAMSTAAHMNPKFNALHSRFRNFRLKLRYRLAFLELASASGTPRGQRHLDNLIDLIGNGPTIGVPVLLSWFAPGFFGSGLGVLPRERGGLPLNRSQRLFQQSLQACVLFFQYFNLSFEPRNFLCARLFCHTDTLAGRRMKTTTFSDIHERKCLDAEQILCLLPGAFAPQAFAQLQAPFGRPDIPVSNADRVYAADQTSNTVSVIDPYNNQLLGVIRLGNPVPGALSPLYRGQLLVHGLGFAPDYKTVAVVSVASNSVTLIDTETNAVKGTIYVGRSPHEAFFTPDGRELWVTVRGEDYVSVIDPVAMKEIRRIQVSNWPGHDHVRSRWPLCVCLFQFHTGACRH